MNNRLITLVTSIILIRAVALAAVLYNASGVRGASVSWSSSQQRELANKLKQVGLIQEAITGGGAS